MRFKTVAMIVGGAFLLVGAPMALAKPPAPPAKPVTHLFSGEVTHLDSVAKTVAVKEHDAMTGKVMTFTLATDAKIMRGAAAKTLGDLKVGDQIKVAYADQGMTHKAHRIDLLPAKVAKAKTHPMSTSKPKASN